MSHRCSDMDRARALSAAVTRHLHGATPEQLRRAVCILDQRTRADAAQLSGASRASFERLSSGPATYADRALQAERLHSATGNGKRASVSAHRSAVGSVRLAYESASRADCAWCAAQSAWLEALEAAGVQPSDAPAAQKEEMREGNARKLAHRRRLPEAMMQELERCNLLEPGRVFRLEADIANSRNLAHWVRHRAHVWQRCFSRARGAGDLDLIRAAQAAMRGPRAAL